MASTNSETGHYKNVANFKGLIQFCESLGSDYRPSRTDLMIPQLQLTHNVAVAMMDQINAAEIAISRTVFARVTAFGELPKLITRIINGLEAINPSSEILNAAHHYVSKARGTRITAPEPLPAGATAEDKPKTRSVSQRSYDARLANFEQLVKILASEPSYQPNETEFTVAALQTRIQDLARLNHDATAAASQMKLLIAQRQRVLYAPVSGLVSIAESVKKYIKALYSATSTEMKAANAFAFHRLK